MLKKFLLTVIFLLPISSISADYFFPDGDSTQNKYFDTLGYGIDRLIGSGDCPGCIEYDANEVSGVYTGDIVGVVSIGDITDVDSVHGLIRNPYVYDSVSLPPFSTVDFIYWYLNNSQESVYISELNVFLSRYDLSKGDLRNVLNVDGIYTEIPFSVYGFYLPRHGVVKTYGGLGIVNRDASNSLVLDTVSIKAPLIFEKWEADTGDDFAVLRVYVTNITSESLNNIEYRHGDYFLKRNFLPNETYIYEYTLTDIEVDSLGYSSVYNPNSKTECIVVGENMDSFYIGESVIVAGIRKKGDLYLQYVGSRVKPLVNAFCIERIAYKQYSSEMTLVNDSESEIPQSEEIEEVGEVMGISILPKTGSINMSRLGIIFLVVIALVWYYLSRRK